MPRDRKFLLRWHTIVSEHYADPEITIQDLARLTCVSQRQLFNRVKGITGENPSMYLKRYRLQKAQLYLAEEAVTISRIAELTGFKSLSTFSKAFREAVGTTPTQHRNALFPRSSMRAPPKSATGNGALKLSAAKTSQ